MGLNASMKKRQKKEAKQKTPATIRLTDESLLSPTLGMEGGEQTVRLHAGGGCNGILHTDHP